MEAKKEEEEEEGEIAGIDRWGQEMPFEMLALIFKDVSAKEHLLVLPHVNSVWRSVVLQWVYLLFEQPLPQGETKISKQFAICSLNITHFVKSLHNIF